MDPNVKAALDKLARALGAEEPEADLSGMDDEELIEEYATALRRKARDLSDAEVLAMADEARAEERRLRPKPEPKPSPPPVPPLEEPHAVSVDVPEPAPPAQPEQPLDPRARHEPTREQHDAMLGLIAHRREREEAQARRDHELSVRDADEPMKSPPTWHEHEPRDEGVSE